MQGSEGKACLAHVGCRVGSWVVPMGNGVWNREVLVGSGVESVVVRVGHGMGD